MTIAFAQSSPVVETFDFIEITVNITPPSSDSIDSFAGTPLTGSFTGADGTVTGIEGFCDAANGSIYRIRFMPSHAGEYHYSVLFRAGGQEARHDGTFTAKDTGRRGLLRVWEEYPWHFRWEGNATKGDLPFFYNSTTAYCLAGWDDATITTILDRFERLGINRIRCALYGPRVPDGTIWFEPVLPTDNFKFLFAPWVAAQPNNIASPEFDVIRFDVAHWQHYESLLFQARERNILVETLFYLDGQRPGTDPFGTDAGGEQEKLYYRYAAARLSAFSNLLWNVSNEYQHFRTVEWATQMGTYLKSCDPYHHLITVHGHGDFPFRAEPWADYAEFQVWDAAGGNRFMLSQREKQEATGRIIPQVNEEYGYEDHYPIGWGNDIVAPARNAENRRRLAWGITLAGCHQTTGERANTGTGITPDTGGGWLNGRGDNTMRLLTYHHHLKTFFEQIPFWKLVPRNELVGGNALCLSEPCIRYVVYLPDGGTTDLRTEAGTYTVIWYNPRTGERFPPETKNTDGSFVSLIAPDSDDWAVLVETMSQCGNSK